MTRRNLLALVMPLVLAAIYPVSASAAHVAPAPALRAAVTLFPGGTPGTVAVALTGPSIPPQMVVAVSAKRLAVPAAGSAAPSDAAAYTVGDDITASTGDYVGIYSVSGRAVQRFSEAQVTAADVAGSERLALSGAASARFTGTASAPITVTLESSAGTPLDAAAPLTVQLQSFSSTGIFATSSGGTPVQTVTIPAGSDNTTVYYGDSTSYIEHKGVATPTTTMFQGQSVPWVSTTLATTVHALAANVTDGALSFDLTAEMSPATDMVCNVSPNPGTVAGTTAISPIPYTTNDCTSRFVESVGPQMPFQAPDVGDAVATAEGFTLYTLGSNIAVQPGDVVYLCELDGAGRILASTAFLITPQNVNDPDSEAAESIFYDIAPSNILGLPLEFSVLLQENGNPIAGHEVSVKATGNAVIQVIQAVTNAEGYTDFDLYDSVAQTVTLSATDVTDGVTLTQTGSVPITGQDEPGQTNTRLNGTHKGQVGVPVTYTVSLKDNYGLAVPGYAADLHFKSVPAGLMFTPAVETSVPGTYTFTVTPRKPGTFTVHVITGDGADIAQSVLRVAAP